MGVTPPEQLAERYDITGADWETLQKWPPFKKAVASKRAEYEASGLTLRLKHRLMAADAVDELYVKLANDDIPMSQRLAATEFLAKLGDLMPNPQAERAVTGPQFSITFNVPEGFADKVNGRGSVLIDQPTDSQSPRPMKIDFAIPESLETPELEIPTEVHIPIPDDIDFSTVDLVPDMGE